MVYGFGALAAGGVATVGALWYVNNTAGGQQIVARDANADGTPKSWWESKKTPPSNSWQPRKEDTLWWAQAPKREAPAAPFLPQDTPVDEEFNPLSKVGRKDAVKESGKAAPSYLASLQH